MEPVPWRDFVVGFGVASEAMAAAGQPYSDGDPGKDAAFRQAQAEGRESLFRIVTALHDRFGRQYVFLSSLLTRYWALLELMQGGQVNEWLSNVESDAKTQNLHPALLLAAAETRLTKNGKFPTRRFRARVEQIIRDEG